MLLLLDVLDVVNYLMKYSCGVPVGIVCEFLVAPFAIDHVIASFSHG